MTNPTDPIVIPGPKPCTPLESALDKLRDDSTKFCHLSPRERDAVYLAYCNERNKAKIYMIAYAGMRNGLLRLAEEVEA
jgi:hypothetical protein